MPRFEPLPERRPALIAGASSGIGAAAAIDLAARLSGRPRRAPGREVRGVVAQIKADGGEAVAVHLDVTDPDSVKTCVERTVDSLGEIEVLVAGAGDTYFGRLHEISTDSFESQVQIHLIGANRVATAVLPGMIERQRGDLIFVGSDVALRQRPHMGAYGAAKAAVMAMVTNSNGTRRNRGACLDRASGTDEDGDGLEPARRSHRPRAGGLGQVGPSPARLFPARIGFGAGHHLRRRDPARRIHREHGTAA